MQKLKARIARVRTVISDESGQMFVLTALSMTVIIAFLGFAIDVGHFRYVKRNLQSAADAAALAAAAEIRICGGQATCSAMVTAAQDAMTENGYTGVTVLQDCSGAAGSGVTLVVNNPACSVSGDPNAGSLNYAEAVVSEPVPTYFARIVGYNSATVSARAEAGRISGPCIYALGGPPGGPYTDAPAISLVAGVLVHSNCSIIDESTSNDALECTIGIGVTAPKIDVSGQQSGLLGLPISLCGLGTTPASTGVPAPTPHDPLAYLPAPPHANDNCPTSPNSGNTFNGSANQVNILLGGTYTFNPGIYCGGISITAALGANITFNPGVYILRQTSTGLLGTGLLSNGGLDITVSALSTITGQGVTFYNEGGSTNITVPATLGLSTFDISAPTSGEYDGILYMQPSTNTSAANFTVSAAQGSIFNGAIYAPDATVNYGVTALSSSYNILVARDINFLAAAISTFGNNYAALQSGSPLNGNMVNLVQ